MTPGRAVYSGTDAPTRPGTRSGFARGSVSGVCPEASRRPAGICATAALATLDQMISSGVSPVNLAGRSLGCPALFGERDHVSAAAVLVPRCAERRRLLTPSPDGSRRHTSRASDTRPWAHVGKQGHHARAGLGRALSPRFIDPPEVREADTLHDSRRDVPLARLAIARRLAMPVGTRGMSNLPGLILIVVIVAAVVTLAAFGIHALWTAATSWWRR